MRLKELRKKKKMLQRQVAEAINCSQAVYSRYESGEREPSKEILAALADFYGVTVDYLLGRDTTQAPALVVDVSGSMKQHGPETQAIAAEVLCEALNHGVTKEEALAFIKNYAQLMPQERKTIMSNMMFLRSQHNEEGET